MIEEQYLRILAAIAPAIVLAVIILRKDRRPEPVIWLLAAVGLGILAGPVVILIGFLLPEFTMDTFVDSILTSFVNAAIPEETVKFAALYFLAMKCKHFDEMYDGVVYAVCIGMGFAGFENILYLFDEEDWIWVGVSRAVMAVPMHYFFAVIMGAFFSLGWFEKRNREVYLTAALLLPILVHGIYDTLCFTLGLDENVSVYICFGFLLLFKYVRRYTNSLINSLRRMDESLMEEL